MIRPISIALLFSVELAPLSRGYAEGELVQAGAKSALVMNAAIAPGW